MPESIADRMLKDYMDILNTLIGQLKGTEKIELPGSRKVWLQAFDKWLQYLNSFNQTISMIFDKEFIEKQKEVLTPREKKQMEALNQNKEKLQAMKEYVDTLRKTSNKTTDSGKFTKTPSSKKKQKKGWTSV